MYSLYIIMIKWRFYRVNDFNFWPGTDAEPLGRRPKGKAMIASVATTGGLSPQPLGRWPKAAALAKSHREKQRSINDDENENG